MINNLTPGASADSNIITATVTSNSPYGFHLSATTGTKNGTTSLVNTADSNFVFTNLDSNKASLSNFSDNTWGYSYSTNNGTSWVSGDYGTALAGYNGLSLDNDDSGATGTTLFNSDSYTNSTAVKFKIGAKSGSTQASGTYTGTVNFYAVAHKAPVTFDMAYADANKEKLNGYYKMQDATTDICAAVDKGQTGEVIDTRDNTVYHIGKLADGNCWLLDNLALDVADSTIRAIMDESNTNASNNTLSYLKNGGGTSTDRYPDLIDHWWSSFSSSKVLVNVVDKDTIPTDTISQAGGFKIGGYYNYCAASAGSYCYGWSWTGYDNFTFGESIGNATEDICPRGWRMPTGGTSGEYSILANIIYGSTDYTNNPAAYANYRSTLRLPLSGMFGKNGVEYRGTLSGFWSSTRKNNESMYHLFLTPGDMTLGDENVFPRYYGESVRCILDS